MAIFDGFFTGDKEQDAARARGLLSAGLALMQARGKLFPALGQAGTSGIGAYDQQRQAQEAQKARAMQMQLQQLQLGQAQREADLAKLPGQFFRQTPAIGATLEEPPTPAANQFDMRGYIEALKSKAPMQAMQLEAALQKQAPKLETLAEGTKAGYIDPKTGQWVQVALNPKAPEQIKPTTLMQNYEKAVSQGYKGTIYDYELTLRRAGAASMNNYGSPVAGVDASGNPAFIVTDKAGDIKMLPGIRPPRSAAEERAAQEQANRSRQSQQMSAAMSDARKILGGNKATASGIGAAADTAARAVGLTTLGAQDAAKLEALSGWLVANVPRMEGPQSNFDVQNYMTMAGKIGDRTVPIRERLAALDSVEKLQSKYSAINAAPTKANQNPSAAPGGWSIKPVP